MISWIKRNKLATFLLIIVAYFLYNYFLGVRGLGISQKSAGLMMETDSFGAVSAPSVSTKNMALPDIYQPEYTPQADEQNRLVIQTSNMSLLVENVIETRNKILDYASANGGYMVSAQTQSPEESPTSTVIIRIPSGNLPTALDYFHSLSIKVVSENLLGRDVTDQYVDIDTRISQLEKTKSRLESILDQATKISDITSLTQQILSYQNQIDNLKGQQISLEKNAQLAKLTIYLSTDEIALPYAPSETFRPKVIFKLAVRSLVSSLRGFARAAIWIVVYAVIWIPLLLIYIFGRRWWKNRQKI